MKKLPEIKKSLKSFILEEDAKVIDKTALKVALTASFLAINFAINSDDANAKGHSNHTNHNNNIAQHSLTGTSTGCGVSYNKELSNENDNAITKIFYCQGQSMDVTVPEKAVATAHGNHYNHIDGAKK